MVKKTGFIVLVALIIMAFSGCSKQAFVLVPSFIQQDVDEVRSWAKENQITLEISQQPAPPSLGVKPGHVMNQAPNPGSEIQPGDSVIIYVVSSAKYDPDLAKANLDADLQTWPRNDSNFDKFADLMASGRQESDLNLEYKALTKLPNTDYKKFQRELNQIQVPREVEGNVAYLSLLKSLNKVVSLQDAMEADPKKLLREINNFEEQRHLLNQLIQ